MQNDQNGNFITRLAVIVILIKVPALGDGLMLEKFHFLLGKHVSSLMFAKQYLEI